MPLTPQLRNRVLEILDANRLMTVATLRPDGWPQATTVGYASDGLELFFLCGADSQKAANLARDNRVSITVDHDVSDPMKIEGVSLAGRAEPIDGEDEVARFLALLIKKYPEYAALPQPDMAGVRCFRVRPLVISVLDYSQGFGHTDLVSVSEDDLAA
ncbi:MAG: pyridoxamine 5'-phosphate oxidase [Alphaproteobacteria bacterium]|nr:MAG: pyridoxamine 5'-phosphate oxidase [Alphaproteobacteria bacterium]